MIPKKLRNIAGILAIGLVAFTIGRESAIRNQDIASAEKLQGLSFTGPERDSMRPGLKKLRKGYKAMREVSLPNPVRPALRFDPIPPGKEPRHRPQKGIALDLPSSVTLPDALEELAFYSLPELASLIEREKLSPVKLTKLYIKRLKEYDDALNCIVSLTEERALREAKRAEEQIAKGNYRGPLHGIPYGVKDLLAVKGTKTTWGAAPFRDQRIDTTATVVRRLQAAGAILVGKLALGALAMGDVWFEGQTRNPWDTAQGSSGSSAGPAAATAAGLVGFSIGSETYGSIVSPSTRCGVTGLRPTFGRVSRFGAMALSWSMDKLGPICRTAEGCAMVFSAIFGPDQKDPTVRDIPFNYPPPGNPENFEVGFLEDAFKASGEQDSLTLQTLRDLGLSLKPVSLEMDSIPLSGLLPILFAEGAAAFDQLTRSDRDSLLTRQSKDAWPNIFRRSRFIPAVEYIQANRHRMRLIQQVNEAMERVDVLVTPSFGGKQLLKTNLTGHPAVVLPNGMDEEGHPTSITFLGNLYEEAKLLSFASYFQKETGFEEDHPSLAFDD